MLRHLTGPVMKIGVVEKKLFENLRRGRGVANSMHYTQTIIKCRATHHWWTCLISFGAITSLIIYVPFSLLRYPFVAGNCSSKDFSPSFDNATIHAPLRSCQREKKTQSLPITFLDYTVANMSPFSRITNVPSGSLVLDRSRRAEDSDAGKQLLGLTYRYLDNMVRSCSSSRRTWKSQRSKTADINHSFHTIYSKRLIVTERRYQSSFLLLNPLRSLPRSKTGFPVRSTPNNICSALKRAIRSLNDENSWLLVGFLLWYRFALRRSVFATKNEVEISWRVRLRA